MQMIVGGLIGLIYSAIALVAMALTTMEQGAKGIGSGPQRLAGLMACAVWPLTLLGMTAAVAYGAWRARPPPA